MKHISLIVTFVFGTLYLWGQTQNIPMNFVLNQEVNIHQNNTGAYTHQSIKPYCHQFENQKVLDYTFKDTSKHFYDFTIFLYRRSLLDINKDDVNITADILLDLSYGKTNQMGRMDNERTYLNTRGFRVTGDIGKNVSFETRFYETQMFLPRFLDSIASSRGIAFGLGRTKPFKVTGLDVGNSSGYVSVKAHSQMNIQFGHDKLFVGNGYRSLLLSDNTSNYPMLRFLLQSKNKKWMYQNVNAWMQSLVRIPTTSSAEALFKRKGGSFKYISYKPTQNLEVGFFEGVIFKNYEDTIGMIPMHYSFYVPIIGFGTAVNGLQNQNNALIGLNASYTMKKFNFFGQLAMDDINKMGYQIGLKWLEPMGWKKNWIHTEFNTVPSFMYTHDTENILQNYTHNFQELAHPLGASFKELILMYHFQKKNWFADVAVIFTQRERQSTTLTNGNQVHTIGEYILLANDRFENSVKETHQISSQYFRLEVGHNFNLKTRMQIFAGLYSRNLNNKTNTSLNQNEMFYALGLRMFLNNNYLDL